MAVRRRQSRTPEHRIATVAQTRRVWCVRHRNGWCATYAGRRPSAAAWSDPTRCKQYVILRWGSERRLPDCPDCLAAMGLNGRVDR